MEVPPEEEDAAPTLAALVDLALCTPEIGAVNFNILRLLLHDIIEKLGIESMSVTLGDVDGTQVKRYRNSISGNTETGVAGGGSSTHLSPGFKAKGNPKHKIVIAIAPSKNSLEPKRPSRKSDEEGQEAQDQKGTDRYSEAEHIPHTSPRILSITQALEDKIGRLERYVEALYKLPANAKLLEEAMQVGVEDGMLTDLGEINPLDDIRKSRDSRGSNAHGMMWQIIQLNNRASSMESAIQKMASLIEEMAGEVGGLRGGHNELRDDADHLNESHNRMCDEFSPLAGKCEIVQEALDELKKDLKGIQKKWKSELGKVTKAMGVDVRNIPSFMQREHEDDLDLDQSGSKGKSKSRRQSARDRSSPDQHHEHSSKRGHKDRDYVDDAHSDDRDRDYDRDRDHRRHGGRSRSPPRHTKHSTESLTDLHLEDLENLTPAELDEITPSLLDLMTYDQKEKIGELKAAAKLHSDLNQMTPIQIKKLKLADLEKFSPAEVLKIRPSRLLHMLPAQIKKLEEIKKRAKKPSSTKHHAININKLNPKEIVRLSIKELSEIDPEQAAELDESVLRMMTPEQRDKIDNIIAGPLDSKLLAPDLIGQLDDSEISRMTLEQIQGLNHDQLAKLNQEQMKVMEQTRAALEEQEVRYTKEETDDRERAGSKSSPARTSKKRHSHGRHGHPHVDIVKGKIPRIEALPQFESMNAKALVQGELQSQYANLKLMQERMASDIQKKMEFIYDKLLKEIVMKNEDAIPYMAVGEPEKIIGPGVCTGHGMPAGVAVCQFPEAQKGQKQGGAKVCPGPGLCPASANCPHCSELAAQNPKAGPGYVVPASATDGEIQDDQDQATWTEARTSQVRNSEARTSKGRNSQGTTQLVNGDDSYERRDSFDDDTNNYSRHEPVNLKKIDGQAVEDTLILKEMRSLILLDLDKIREDIKEKDHTFDETDIIERLDTIWEAIKIIKNNEETLAVKILRQDAVLKKLPRDTIDRIHKIPSENLDALAAAKWDKPMLLPSETALVMDRTSGSKMKIGPLLGHRRKSSQGSFEEESTGQGRAQGSGQGLFNRDEAQNIYNNLANIMAETTEHKLQLAQMTDQVRTMEVGMVTKQMLVEVLGDKADRGQMNTKVSYDEFGTAVEELHSNLRDLIVDGLTKHDHWKRITDELEMDVGRKLDKVELTPVTAFFKSHIKALDQKVRRLQKEVEEPDPAGTRKKLLRDYNCISCDRHCNITGMTQIMPLPRIGPLPSAHVTASKRAFDLHKLRHKPKFDQDCRDLALMEKQMRCMGIYHPECSSDRDIDMNLVTRYHGGSHTAITNSARIRASHPGTARKSSDKGAAKVSPPKVDSLYSFNDEEVLAMPEIELPQYTEMEGEGGGFYGQMRENPYMFQDQSEELTETFVPSYIEE